MSPPTYPNYGDVDRYVGTVARIGHVESSYPIQNVPGHFKSKMGGGDVTYNPGVIPTCPQGETYLVPTP